MRYLKNIMDDRKSLRSVKDSAVKEIICLQSEYKTILGLVKNDDITLNRKIERLDTMQNLFKYWHVAHLPFALVMLIIMIIHVAVTIVFGYRWIF